jgi:hypothetical protein
VLHLNVFERGRAPPQRSHLLLKPPLHLRHPRHVVQVHREVACLENQGSGVTVKGWFKVYGSWFMVYGLWFMVCGLWFMVYGLCFTLYALCFMIYTSYFMVKN